MKKLLVLIISIASVNFANGQTAESYTGLGVSLIAAAQTDYYANKDTVMTSTGIVYRINAEVLYTISDITNTRAGRDTSLPDGSVVPDPTPYKITFIGDMPTICNGIFREVFTTSQIEAFKDTDQDILLSMAVLPSGDIAEVEIQFDKHPIMYSIPPDKWHEFETKIKQRMKYNVSAKGKTAQFICCVYIWGFRYLQGL